MPATHSKKGYMRTCSVIFGALLSALLSALVVCALGTLSPLPAFAATLSSGVIGRAQWELADTGSLLIHDGTLPDTFFTFEVTGTFSPPWDVQAVRSVRFHNVQGAEFQSLLLAYHPNLVTCDLRGLDVSRTRGLAYFF